MFSCRTGNGLRRPRLAVVLCASLVVCMLLAFPVTADAKASLWLYPVTDDPRSGGHVLDTGSFTLVVENVGSGDDTAEDVELVIALNDLSLLTSGVLMLPDSTVVDLEIETFETGTPIVPCSDSPIPPHGVYPAPFITAALGNIAPGESVFITVDVQGLPGFELHFDATAIGWKQAGRSEKCYDVVNPSGHDVTVVIAGDAESECTAVSIDKSAPSTGVVLNDQLDYTIVVTNTGTCDLTDVVVTEDIPTVDNNNGGTVPAFTVIAADPALGPDDGTGEGVTWPVGVLTPGATEAFSITASFVEILADGQEIENTACISAAELTEPVCDSFEVAVGEEDDETGAGSAGFWCNRIRLVTEQKGNPTYTIEELGVLLADVDAASVVFSEYFDATTVEAARELLCGSHGSDAEGKLVRQLLALHLNVAAGRIAPETTLEGLCAGDEQLPADVTLTLTVAEVTAGAEAALVPPPAERATLLNWKDIIDFINNASMAEGGVCADAELHGVQLRRSRRMPRR